MPKIGILLLVSGLLSLTSCGGKNDLEVSIPVTTNYLNEGTRKSCSLLKDEEAAKPDQPAANDVQSKYFQLPRVEVKWSDPNSNLNINKITVTFPNGEIPACTLGTQELYALHQKWYVDERALLGSMAMYETDGTLSPVQPTYRLTLDCPIICGNISTTSKFSATGILEIRGSQVDKNGYELNYPPVSITTTVTVISD